MIYRQLTVILSNAKDDKFILLLAVRLRSSAQPIDLGPPLGPRATDDLCSSADGPAAVLFSVLSDQPARVFEQCFAIVAFARDLF